MADPDELGDTDCHYSEIQDSGVSSLTGFLFGNIDEKGELEGDFLDEVNSKKTKQNDRLKYVSTTVQEFLKTNHQ